MPVSVILTMDTSINKTSPCAPGNLRTGSPVGEIAHLQIDESTIECCVVISATQTKQSKMDR